SLDKKSTIGGCQFLGCRLISWQCKKQTIVVTSSTEAENVATASGCAQVLWIQNQLLDYSDSPLLGVNTPRSDEDRLKLIELIVFLLQKDVCVEIEITAARLSSYCCQANKLDAAEGFEQIIDFLSGSYIYYALTVSPQIYISCIKQFWNTASVKRSGDVTRLQALVDKKKIVISEVVIREILQLDDAEGVVCLPNEEIFAGLAQMGYEKPMASAVICLSKGQRFNFSKYIFDSLVRNVDSSSNFYMYPRFIQLIIQNQVRDLSTHTTRFISSALTQNAFANMRRVGKVFSGVETPLFEGMLVARQPAEEGLVDEQVQVDDAVAAAVEENVAEDVAHDAIPSPPPHDIPSPSQEPSSPLQQPQSSPQAPPQSAKLPPQLQQVLNVCSALTKRIENLENDNATQKLLIIKLKARGRMIDDMDKDEGIELVKDAEVAESEGRHAEQAKNSAASATIPAASPTIPAAALTVVVAYTRKRKGVIIRDPEEELSLKTSTETPAETPKVKDKGKGILVETPKPMKKKDQIEMDAEYARKLHEEINRDEFNKDIDWDAAMDHVNKKSNNPQYIKRYQGMKKRPQTESEAHKNMMIYLKNIAGYKMDFFKGMMYAQICPIFQARFDENIRFLFKSSEEMEEEDQEIIKSINETSAQKAAKRRKLSEEVQEAKDLRKRLKVVEDEDDDVFVEATPLAQKVPVVDYQIVLVDNKPRYPLSRFTLEQLVNVTRLQVEEESGMYLELLRFTRQQLQEYQQG
nr:putative reverse transcriptase, RNA-dependent DNA polymerase [Tanacetum cinerariifolium]